MTHTVSNLCCASPDCAVTPETAHSDSPALSGSTWRSALSALGRAPLRLHKYRNFHTEVVEDAIRAYDYGRCL